MGQVHLLPRHLPHPGVTMLGRSRLRRAQPGDLPVGSDSPVWKIHCFHRGLFHWRVGDRRLDLPPRTWLVIPPGTVHGGEGALREAGTFSWMHLGDGSWPGCDADTTRRLHTRFAVLHEPIPGAPDDPALWDRLLHSAQDGGDWRLLAFTRAFLDVIAALLAASSGVATRTGPRTADPVARAIAHLRDHPDDRSPIETLAGRAGLGRSRFGERFLAATGMTPREYRDRLRLARAQRLLAESRRSITAIAYEVGFSSSQNFATAFRRLTGCSPGDWRRQRSS